MINPGILSNGKMHIVGETMDGTHAELIAVPRDFVHPIPDALSFEEAAAFPLVFVTAYRMLVTRARLQEGEWVLIWGIGGGVATAALAIAKALGAHVAVTSSSDEKLTRARELGADLAVNHETGDVVAAVQEATGGGAHVVVDDVGEATWKRTLESARAEARIVVCGATTGPNPPAALHRIWWKQLSILGSSMGTPADFQGVYDLIAAGRAHPVVDRVFPLADAREHTSGWKPASSSGRSCSRFRPEPRSAPAEPGHSRRRRDGGRALRTGRSCERDRRCVGAGERVPGNRDLNGRGDVDLAEAGVDGRVEELGRGAGDRQRQRDARVRGRGAARAGVAGLNRRRDGARSESVSRAVREARGSVDFAPRDRWRGLEQEVRLGMKKEGSAAGSGVVRAARRAYASTKRRSAARQRDR